MNKWYETAVFYHIYPLGLCGAPRENKGEGVEHRLPGLEEWLPHIADLGCQGLYIGPLFESSGHGYDTKDYKLVDRRLGDNEDLKHFVKKASNVYLLLWWTACLTIRAENSLPLRISGAAGRLPLLRLVQGHQLWLEQRFQRRIRL